MPLLSKRQMQLSSVTVSQPCDTDELKRLAAGVSYKLWNNLPSFSPAQRKLVHCALKNGYNLGDVLASLQVNAKELECINEWICKEAEPTMYENNKEELENEILNNSYEVYLTPNSEHGLGLVINIDDDGILVKDFKKIDNIILPAQKCTMISIGDRLIKINEHDLNKMTIKDSINLLKNYNSKSEEVTLQFLNKINIRS